MHILINNDDGIEAPGIENLIYALKDYAQITVVAPEGEQSGKSMSITTREPLVVNQVSKFGSIPAWSVRGTPADCTKVALSIFKIKPDLIVSGINRGSNAGRNVLYSGTVGGVIEGILRGIPGIAFSCCDMKDPEYHRLTPFIEPMISFIQKNPLPFGTLLNVNFPHTQEDTPWNKTTQIQGIKLTSQGKAFWVEDVYESEPILSNIRFGAKAMHFSDDEQSDIYWLERGYITAVPIHVDQLTDFTYFSKNKDHFEYITTCPVAF